MRLLTLVILFASLAFGDGGTVVFHKPAGDFDVTLFSKSDALRAGVNDLSVMVQNRRDNSTVMNAAVLMHLEQTQTGGAIVRLTGIATHAKATNKLLYASSVNIPSTGAWRLLVDVTADGKSGTASGDLSVQAPLPPMENYWPLVAMVPLLGIAFVINRKLRARFRARTR